MKFLFDIYISDLTTFLRMKILRKTRISCTVFAHYQHTRECPVEHSSVAKIIGMLLVSFFQLFQPDLSSNCCCDFFQQNQSGGGTPGYKVLKNVVSVLQGGGWNW